MCCRVLQHPIINAGSRQFFFSNLNQQKMGGKSLLEFTSSLRNTTICLCLSFTEQNAIQCRRWVTIFIYMLFLCIVLTVFIRSALARQTKTHSEAQHVIDRKGSKCTATAPFTASPHRPPLHRRPTALLLLSSIQGSQLQYSQSTGGPSVRDKDGHVSHFNGVCPLTKTACTGTQSCHTLTPSWRTYLKGLVWAPSALLVFY